MPKTKRYFIVLVFILLKKFSEYMGNINFSLKANLAARTLYKYLII